MKKWKYSRRLLGLLLIAGLSGSGCRAQNTPVSTQQYESYYRFSHQLEVSYLYGQANVHYDTLIRKLTTGREKNDIKIPRELMPLAIASAYRQSVVVAKENFSSSNKLIDEIRDFEAVNQNIDFILENITKINSQSESPIPKEAYACLFFARAYNRIAWSHKLLQSVAWKNYIVTPLDDIRGMLQQSQRDLNRFLELEGMNTLILANPQDSEAALIEKTTQFYIKNSAAWTGDNPVWACYRYAFFETDKAALAKTFAKRNIGQAAAAAQYLGTDFAVKALDEAGHPMSVDQIIGQSREGIFLVSAKLVDLMGYRP